METSLAESQTDSYFPTKWSNSYPNLERSVKSISLRGGGGGGGRGLKSILRGHNPRTSAAV